MLDILTLVQILEDKGAFLRTLLTVIVNESSTISFTDRLASCQGLVPRLRFSNLLLIRLLLLPGWPIRRCFCRLCQLIQVQMKLLIFLDFGNCLLLRKVSLKHRRRVGLLVSAASV